MSHTKGEWRATPINTVVAGKKGCQIAIMQRCGRPQKEMIANARLIAAAPDLLEVCKGLMEKADNGSADFDDPEPGSIYLKAKAVIAKAVSLQ